MRKIIAFLLFFVAFLSGAEKFSPSLGIFYDEQKANLGKRLFFDKRLSNSEKKSCETCHNLYWDFSGSIRKNSDRNLLNPPSVLNAATSYIFFKNGSVRDISEQVAISITSDIQLGIDEQRFVAKISDISDYRSLFGKIYSDGVTFKNAVNALVEFERAIYTASSPFDKFLMGDKNALNEDEKKGYEIFQKVGCVACHSGVNLGSNLLQEKQFYKNVLSGNSVSDKTGQNLYKVPSLRNIARTAPYMSDGSILYLKDAITHVSDLQLMQKLSKEQVDLIYKFLLSLNGEHPRILR